MSVQYEEAMQTLSVMFASMSREVIDAVLRANQWHMEKTIDSLLSMSDSSAHLSPTVSRTDPVVLPTPPENPHQIEQDEMLAKALQNELFLGDVNNNQELNGSIPQGDGDNLKEMKEKFNQIGEAAKHKLREFSTMFFNKKDAKYEAVSTAGSTTNSPELLDLNSPEQQSTEEADEEVVAFDAKMVRKSSSKLRPSLLMMSDDEEEESPHLIDRRYQRPLTASGDIKKSM